MKRGALHKIWKDTLNWTFNGNQVGVEFKEIETEEEFFLFESLQKFHYRGGGGAGRTVPLIAKTKLWDLPQAVGFIEISSSMIANTARKKFFDYPYQEASGLHWNSWDRDATKKYSNTIARISRFVVHPEVRGLGFARLFLTAARTYAAERWHYGGYRPRFLEITADMLRYYPFLDSNFVFMGETEGNEHRLSRDMQYLIRRSLTPEGAKGMPQGGGGIMTLQRGYALQLLRYMNENGKALPEVIASLRSKPAELDQESWEALHRLNRKPKPCFVSGLTDEAKVYLARRSVIMKSSRISRSKSAEPRLDSFRVERLSITVRSKMAQSSSARALQDAFGFVGAELESEIIRDLSCEFHRGEITFVCGASGSGKSLLSHSLQILFDNQQRRRDEIPPHSCDQSIEVTGEVNPRARVVQIPELPASSTPLELAADVSLERFLSVSAKCGLAEPQVFVRPIDALSSGQKYRLQIALAFLKRPDILVIDNFCEPLDRFTAFAVCRGLRALVRETGAAAIVSTAAYERLLNYIQPDQTILLRRGNAPLVKAGGFTKEHET